MTYCIRAITVDESFHHLVHAGLASGCIALRATCFSAADVFHSWPENLRESFEHRLWGRKTEPIGIILEKKNLQSNLQSGRTSSSARRPISSDVSIPDLMRWRAESAPALSLHWNSVSSGPEEEGKKSTILKCKDVLSERRWALIFWTVHLDGGGAVEAERLGLAVLQVDLQDVRHEEQGAVLHWVLRMEKKKKVGRRFTPDAWGLTWSLWWWWFYVVFFVVFLAIFSELSSLWGKRRPSGFVYTGRP